MKTVRSLLARTYSRAGDPAETAGCMGFLRRCLVAWVLCVGGVCRAHAEDASPQWLYDSVPTEWDGAEIESRTWRDDDGLIQRLEMHRRRGDGMVCYVHHATSAVCGDADKQSSCKIHRFRAYYDELGAFLGYRVSRSYPFTRAEHEPFRPADYALLDRVLRNPVHVLGTVKSHASGLDGVTGATATYLAEQAVPGAFYTSYTVWDLVQRVLPERVQRWTLDRSTPAAVRDWLRLGQPLAVWWWLDHAEDSGMSLDVKQALAYEFLGSMQPEVQAAALRFLQRTQAPFRPSRAMGQDYARLADRVKPDFLDWWRSHAYAPAALVEALREELTAVADQRSPVTPSALTYLAGSGMMLDARWRFVLRTIAEKNPSTYARQSAARILSTVGNNAR